MINRVKFFAQIKPQLFAGLLSQKQVNGIDAILDHWESNPKNTDLRWLAYMLATAYHETAKTMQPIEETGKGHGRPYGSKIKMSRKPYEYPNKIYYGRGHVQLTWYENYLKFGQLLQVDLLNEPEQALKMDISVKIMYLGMTRGLFTGVNLARYFNDEREDWVNSRKIINGLDKADVIAGYGKRFHECLTASGFLPEPLYFCKMKIESIPILSVGKRITTFNILQQSANTFLCTPITAPSDSKFAAPEFIEFTLTRSGKKWMADPWQDEYVIEQFAAWIKDREKM